jgi:replicative DNA helicase
MTTPYEAEQQLIGIWLRNLHTDHMNFVREDEFRHLADLYRAIKNCIATVGCVDLLEIAKETEYAVKDLANIAKECEPFAFRSYYRWFKTFSVQSRLQTLATINGGVDMRKEIASLSTELDRISAESVEDEVDMYMSYYHELEARANERERMKWGIPKLDELTGGFKRGELTIVAARPGCGKSAFALQVSDTASKLGKVLFVSLEMSRNSIIDRLVLRYTDIPSHSVKTGKLSDRERAMLDNGMKYLPTIRILDKTMTLTGIRSAVERYLPDLLVVDQLGLVRGDGRFNTKREELSQITRQLKLLAMERDISVIGIAQVNRNAQEKIPTLADLKESGTLEEDGDNVIAIHRMSREDCRFITEIDEGDYDHYVSHGEYPSLLMLLKHRSGEIATIPSVFIGKKMAIREVSQIVLTKG